MRRIIVLAVLAFALIAGTDAVLTVHSHQAVADCPSGNC
jgi:hypothetical protein